MPWSEWPKPSLPKKNFNRLKKQCVQSIEKFKWTNDEKGQKNWKKIRKMQIVLKIRQFKYCQKSKGKKSRHGFIENSLVSNLIRSSIVAFRFNSYTHRTHNLIRFHFVHSNPHSCRTFTPKESVVFNRYFLHWFNVIGKRPVLSTKLYKPLNNSSKAAASNQSNWINLTRFFFAFSVLFFKPDCTTHPKSLVDNKQLLR